MSPQPAGLLLKYVKAEPGAFAPTRASPKSAGYDLRSAVDTFVMSEGKAMVTTGLKIELPDGCYGRIAPRSGLAMNNFINVAGKGLTAVLPVPSLNLTTFSWGD